MEISLDTFRYVIALLMLLCAPPALLIWFLIHPFVSVWRRLGVVPSYLFFIGLMILLGWGIWQSRAWLMRIEYGSHLGLFGLALLFVGVATALGFTRKRRLDWLAVIGVPELSASTRPRALVTDGIYSRVRNPRYLETILFFFGLALFANYLAVYLALAAGLPILHAVILLEERELAQTFGETYLSYCRRVPRYIPNLFR